MTIPAMHAEVEQVFIAAELAQCRSLCITSCRSGEGVTSLASALTERYLLAGYRTLIIDLNIHKPGFRVLELSNSNKQECWIEHVQSSLCSTGESSTGEYSTGKCFTGIPSPTDSPTQLAYKRPGYLKENVEQWHKQFERIVIDTCPLLNINKANIPAQVVATACDQTILTVLAGSTSKHDIERATKRLDSEQIQLLGTVLNTRNQPTLASELCREISRIALLPVKWRTALMNKVKRNSFLSMSI